ncbi:energy-coupling factor transporter transmembrane component T family protein [Anabaena subtropica]|uniref:Energy-coupling factor transporter transmembrane protein EcfT n=1 Tax=Anabaena subtropica FACHB-260 TaxID=2692884 RepID=A0ABR8CRQ0_9NOST|nr:energy-coupling factor transporter transmembrane protein EcfT [Anabaena subtropica]MBD2345861.1 energy-coupling factor transporter transmembrane protein EcfT [Anabaena subtropica FACHB-260]
MDLLRSLPLGLYLEQPQTWLHKLDPRVKFIWLMSFLTSYSFANNFWRILLVALLILFTLIAKIPRRVWQQQMGWLLTLAFFVFAIASISPDGLGVSYQPRLPANPQVLTQPANTNNSPDVPQQVKSSKNYSYVLFHKGPVRVTRRSLDLAVRLSTIIFTVIYSTNLYLLTTAPEEITSGIESLMQPLRRFKIPVTEITLTLTLSLRFIPLVLEEVQNLIRSIMTRAINWKKLGLKGAVKVWMIVAERLLENLLLRASQMASAMMVRGFTSPNEHRVPWHDLRLKSWDWLAIAILTLFWGIRVVFGNQI